MKEGGGFDCTQLPVIINANSTGEPYRKPLDASNMTVGNLVLCVNRHGQGLNRRQVQRVDLCEVPVCVIESADCRLEHEIGNDQQGGENDNESGVD